MIVATSTIEQIHQHLKKYAPTIEDRLMAAMAGHAGRDLRKGLVKRWPAVKFTRLTYDHNVYTACVAYPSKREVKNETPCFGLMVEYECEHGRQLAMYDRFPSGKSFVTIVSNHAIRRVRERLHWEDVDWYTLVQRIMIMMDGAHKCPDLHRYGDPNEVSYSCPKGEFCGCGIGNNLLIRTFIGFEQMNGLRDAKHQANREWYEKNIGMLMALDPDTFLCLSTYDKLSNKTIINSTQQQWIRH